MSKYTKEFKLKVVKHYLETGSGYSRTANKFNLPNSGTVRKWCKLYEEYGEEGIAKRKNSHHSGKFKQEVVEYMHDNYLSASETSIKFNISISVLLKWERIYYEEGPQGLFIERRGRNNMNSKPRKKKLNSKVEKDLIEEIQQLRMENEYLKKLNALVQERVNRENKKK